MRGRPQARGSHPALLTQRGRDQPSMWCQSSGQWILPLEVGLCSAIHRCGIGRLGSASSSLEHQPASSFLPPSSNMVVSPISRVLSMRCTRNTWSWLLREIAHLSLRDNLIFQRRGQLNNYYHGAFHAPRQTWISSNPVRHLAGSWAHKTYLNIRWPWFITSSAWHIIFPPFPFVLHLYCSSSPLFLSSNRLFGKVFSTPPRYLNWSYYSPMKNRRLCWDWSFGFYPLDVTYYYLDQRAILIW